MKKGIILKNKLWIVSDRVRSGKTSLLSAWIREKKVGGFLTPDIDEIRLFYDIIKDIYIDFEAIENSVDTTSIGRFHFLDSTFDYGCQLITKSLEKQDDYFIIDEFGKLELKDEGFGPAINSLISNLLEKHNQTTYIIVVRDYLVEDFLEKFGLKVEVWKEF